jgi:NAD+ synthase
MSSKLSPAVLELDLEAEAERIGGVLRDAVGKLRRRGLVLGLSGGIDSSTSGALAARALGPDKVLGILMPDKDSSAASQELGRAVAETCGMEVIVEDITPTLEAIGCYRWRDAAIREVFPDYGPGWKNKIVIAGGIDGGFNFFKLVVADPSGRAQEKRLPLVQYLQIVAAMNFKQRVRKTLEYFHADRLNRAVIGTPNRLEYDQGFFVKNGDGSADVKPIAHLYKTQVYAMARHLGLPEKVCAARPTTDTYSLPQGQDEFYFALPYEKMDLALWARNHGVAAAELATAIGVTEAQATWVYKDIDAKRVGTWPLHARPILMSPVDEVHG